MIANWIAVTTGAVGAVTGMASFYWNVHSWRREGPVLRVTARLDTHDEELTIRGAIRNAGRFEATITGAYLDWMPDDVTKPMKERVLGGYVEIEVPGRHFVGMKFPQVIKGQSGAEFMIVDLDDLHPDLLYGIAADAILRITFETAVGELFGWTMDVRYRDSSYAARQLHCRPSRTRR
jgi:hypothetical protein